MLVILTQKIVFLNLQDELIEFPEGSRVYLDSDKGIAWGENETCPGGHHFEILSNQYTILN